MWVGKQPLDSTLLCLPCAQRLLPSPLSPTPQHRQPGSSHAVHAAEAGAGVLHTECATGEGGVGCAGLPPPPKYR